MIEIENQIITMLKFNSHLLIQETGTSCAQCLIQRWVRQSPPQNSRAIFLFSLCKPNYHPEKHNRTDWHKDREIGRDSSARSLPPPTPQAPAREPEWGHTHFLAPDCNITLVITDIILLKWHGPWMPANNFTWSYSTEIRICSNTGRKLANSTGLLLKKEGSIFSVATHTWHITIHNCNLSLTL